MKKIYILLVGAMALFSACHDPEYVLPTADHQGFTSLTAIFTSGPFVGQEMAKLNISENETSDRYIIQVPWYYPETSDNETAQYMTNVRVRAELQPNCTIEPGLGILDLTQDNYFTYTNAQGVQREICITGERVKSNKCELVAFNIVEPVIAGVVNKNTRKISLISSDDLSACLAEAQLSPHATISPDPSIDPINYNVPMEFTVTAHNGVDKTVYTVVKEVPDKISKGFNANHTELLFNFDPVSNLGVPNYSVGVGPTIAALDGQLIICYGDGSTPICLNGLNGSKIGEINLGNAIAGSVTNDEAENLLIVNHANAGETVNIYRTASTKDVPTLFHSFTNLSTFPMGSKMKVIGDIDEDAIIVIPNEGISGVSSCNEFTAIQVRNSVIASVESINIANPGIAWGGAPVNTAGIAAADIDRSAGWFESMYDPSYFHWIKADGSIGVKLGSDSSGWGLNPNCIDTKRFNNATYAALFVVSHFPHWGMGPQLYLFNADDPSTISGDNVWDSPALAMKNNAINWYQTADAGAASGDVVIAPSANGFKMYVYYYDHNSGVIGGYATDCIAD